jgi:quercetin dioxygenase-like cupin family protein
MKKKPTRLAASAKPKSITKKNLAPTSPVALKGTISKTKRKADLRYIPWSTVAIEALKPDLGRQLVVGQNIMLARVLMKKGCIVPEHSHPNEQVTYILEGALKFWISGQEIVVSKGEVLTIPPNMPHKAEALEDTVDLDVFDPPRADWMSGTDTYLR